jgi:hypothetical protein
MHFSVFLYEALKNEAFQITVCEICRVKADLIKPVVEMSTIKSTEIYNVETDFLKLKISCYFTPHNRKHYEGTNFLLR